MRRLFATALASLIIAAQGTAHGQDERPAPIGARIITSGFFYGEHQIGGTDAFLASPAYLAAGDLRLVVGSTRRLNDVVGLYVDGRVRGTGNFQNVDYENKFLQVQPATIITARGYAGGPEFEVRQVYLDFALSRAQGGTREISVRLGRMWITEADVLKLDGARLLVQFGQDQRFGISAFAGGAPNPYSRSVLTDYTPPCGAGVANEQIPRQISNLSFAGDACASPGAQLSFAAGVGGLYRAQPRGRQLWGNLGLVASFFGGVGDGGPLVDNGNLQVVGNLQPPQFDRDTPRVYFSWVNQVQLLSRWDLFSQVLVDFAGSHGTQLTRALLVNNFRITEDGSVILRASYAYLSSLAVDMFLSSLLYNRLNGTTLIQGAGLQSPGIVENNLTVQRIGRHEGRLTIDLRPSSYFHILSEGRLRHRSLLDGERAPAVFDQSYLDNQRSLAGDVTLGLRDLGSIRNVQAGATYTFLQDFRARNHVIKGNARFSLWKPRSASLDGFLLDVDYAALLIGDEGAGLQTCSANLNLNPANAPAGQRSQVDAVSMLNVFRLDPRLSLFAPDCYGRRRGTTHEAGVSMSLMPHYSWMLWLDYRFTAMLTDPQNGVEIPTVFGHTAIIRMEWRRGSILSLP